MGHEHKILEAEQAAAKAAEGNAPAAAQTGEGDAGGEAAPIRMHARGAKGVEGCMMEGSLRVKRVPVRPSPPSPFRSTPRSAAVRSGLTLAGYQGNLHIQFTHDNMDYKNSLINATHVVSHLTFGDKLPVSVASLLDKVDADGPGFNTLADHEFVSEHADRTYEHFIQVSPPTHAPYVPRH